MILFNIVQRYTVKLTVKAPYREAEELQIGQVLVYQDPREKDPCWFGFSARYLQEFDCRLNEDGRDTLDDLLSYIKTSARDLLRRGLLPGESKLSFSMIPEQVF